MRCNQHAFDSRRNLFSAPRCTIMLSLISSLQEDSYAFAVFQVSKQTSQMFIDTKKRKKYHENETLYSCRHYTS